MNAGFWNERYRSDAYAYGREPNAFLRDEVARLPQGPVLCLAEGEGRNAVFLAERGFDVTAVDFSAEGVRKTQQLARERNVTVKTVLADLAAFQPPPSSFSAVVAIFAHLPPDVRARVHGWVSTVLRPGGVFVLEAYSPKQLAFGTGGPKDVTYLMTLESLRTELVGLSFVIAREVERDIQEGTFHSGQSATVQVVAAR